MKQLEVIEYEHRVRDGDGGIATVGVRCPDWSKIPGEDARLVTCKRRGCPRCGPNWAKDWFSVISLALGWYCATHGLRKFGAVVMLTITAPGDDLLPWDEDHCAHRRPHRHRGPSGCRVLPERALQWSESLTWRWSKLLAAGRLGTRRDLARDGELGPGPTVLLRAYEPQKRGVPHLHVVLGYGTEAERDAAHVFVGHVQRLAEKYEFGFVDGRGKRTKTSARPVVERHGVQLRPMSGGDAARYVSTYLTGRNSKKKSSIRDNIADPTMPMSLLWLSPVLTRMFDESMTAAEIDDAIADIAAGGGDDADSRRRRLLARRWIQALRERIGVPGGTGITMRLLRRARHLAAAIEGHCEPPRWRDTEDAVVTLSAFLQVFRKRPPPTDLAPAIQVARETDRRVKRTVSWRRYEEQLLPFALQLVEQCMPTAAADEATPALTPMTASVAA